MSLQEVIVDMQNSSQSAAYKSYENTDSCSDEYIVMQKAGLYEQLPIFYANAQLTAVLEMCQLAINYNLGNGIGGIIGTFVLPHVLEKIKGLSSFLETQTNYLMPGQQFELEYIINQVLRARQELGVIVYSLKTSLNLNSVSLYDRYLVAQLLKNDSDLAATALNTVARYQSLINAGYLKKINSNKLDYLRKHIEFKCKQPYKASQYLSTVDEIFENILYE